MEILHSPFTVLINGELIEDILVDGTSIGCEVGAILRFARAMGSASIESIATVVDKSMNFIYQIERNERKASPTLLRALAKAYYIPNHYPLLALLDNILTVDEYMAIIKRSYAHTITQEIDLYRFLKDMENSVLYDGRKLEVTHRYMVMGALEILNQRWNEQCTQLDASKEK